MERTRLQSWLNFVSSELHKGFSPLFNPSMPEEAKKIFRERLAGRFAHLNTHLANNDYLMGKEFSVADAYLITVSNWASRVDLDLSSFPNVLAYRKRVGARPAVQAALKAEGLK
jgi:glutathione S-transferase